MNHCGQDALVDACIAICTHNRAKSLGRTLESLVNLDVPAGLTWEVIVIDNKSTDRTRDVIKRFEAKLPIRWVFEDMQGRSYARNRALQEASGDLLLFIDDDVIVSRQWLRAMVSSASACPEVSFFGGPILPRYIDGRPRWLDDELEKALSAFVIRYVPFERDAEILSDDAIPPTANLCLRTSVVTKHGLTFDPKFGGDSVSLIRGEDTVFVCQMLRYGLSGRYVCDAQVWHVNDSRRMSLAYLWKWARGSGYTQQMLLGRHANVRCILGIPLWVIRSFMGNAARLAIFPLRQRKGWVRNWVGAAQSLGMILAAVRSVGGTRRSDSAR